MRRASPLSIFAGLALAASIPAIASTIAPPANLGELARMSRAVVLAEARGSRTELRGETPVTVTRFELVRQVAGEKVDAQLELRVLGGESDGVGLAVQGAPRFEEGGRYLLFLDRAEEGAAWRPRMLSYGVLKEGDDGVLRPVPEAAQLNLVNRPGVEPVGSYSAGELLPRLAAAAAGSPWHGAAAGRIAGTKGSDALDALAGEAAVDESLESLFAPAVNHAPPVCAYLHSQDNKPVRWFNFETGANASIWHTTPGQVGLPDGGLAAVTEGLAAWRNHDASVIRFDFAGSRPRTAACVNGSAAQQGVNEVIFNDPCGELPALESCGGTLPPGWTNPCCGEVAVGGVFYNANVMETYDGQAWRPVVSPFVIVNDGSQCLGVTDFKEMITHQLGHGLGFWHHADPNATMSSELGVHAPRGAALAATDRSCAAAVYHTFKDVPFDHFAWRFVEAIENASVTGGCGNGNFCPTGKVTRESMAVFLLVAMEGAGYTPPACTTPVFNDVPCSSPFAPWINELNRREVVFGCGNGNYCPTGKVTREQMAVFLLATFEGPGYDPPACTTPDFSDVPCSSSFAPWISELVDRGITAGCGSGNYCPATQITRDQMAVFLTVTFGLPTPTP
ncbi:MAG TPA: S-layer homology domain-containing protein [Thermoanaerobaculia bacterium]|nr:S-layer homology domain-containing protein [Thermoanaerobaculia bacterium]